MVDREEAMTMVAKLCLLYGLQPQDLEQLAHQLAEFDAVNDAITGERNHVHAASDRH